MREIKVTKELSGEIDNIKSAGEALNDSFKKVLADDVSTLETAIEYIIQHNKLRHVIDEYKVLISKDIADIEKMIQTVETTDKKLSAKNKK